MSTSNKDAFFKQLNLSETTTRNYIGAFNSSFLKNILHTEFNIVDIFEITELETLWQIYSKINLHPKNVANHRIYSAAIMKYIRYLNNGAKYGRRIDYKKTGKKHKKTCNNRK